MTGRLTLVTGGARSGKSRWALDRASATSGQVLFLATGVATDDEMAARIEAHQAQRPPAWQTLETRYDLAAAIRAGRGPRGCVLLEDVGTWITNLLLERAAGEREVRAEIAELVRLRAETSLDLIVVSNEAGMGLVPPTDLGRRFRDLLGLANQDLAASAEEVLLLVAGLPLKLKG